MKTFCEGKYDRDLTVVILTFSLFNLVGSTNETYGRSPREMSQWRITCDFGTNHDRIGSDPFLPLIGGVNNRIRRVLDGPSRVLQYRHGKGNDNVVENAVVYVKHLLI